MLRKNEHVKKVEAGDFITLKMQFDREFKPGDFLKDALYSILDTPTKIKDYTAKIVIVDDLFIKNKLTNAFLHTSYG